VLNNNHSNNNNDNDDKLKPNHIKFHKIYKGHEINEGDGAKVIRVIGTEIRNWDPFLMFDFYSTKLPGGFPDHPHRGFETITYQLSGTMLHEDFKGHKGEINPGDVQWMTAGKGIIHAEMPSSFTELSVGFQLWVNLRSDYKMIDSKYQEVKNDNIPVYYDTNKNYKVKVISGKYNNLVGPCESKTPTIYFDIELNNSNRNNNFNNFKLEIGIEKSGFIFVYEGEIIIQNKTISKGYAGLFKQGSGEYLIVDSEVSTSKFLVIAAEPLNEPIVQHGPFVMNTKREINDAISDHQFSRNGFESARDWMSKIQFLKDKPNHSKNDL